MSHKSPNGELEYLSTIIRDITERKRAENLIHAQRDLAIALNAVRKFDKGLNLCMETALSISDMDCGGIYLVDESSGSLDLIFSKGLPSNFVRSISHYDADSPNARIVMAGKPVYTQHQQLDTILDKHERYEELRAIAVLPLHHEDRVIGCLNVASHTFNEVPEYARTVLETIASQIGNAITRLQTAESLNKERDKAQKYLELVGVMFVALNAEGDVALINRRGCEVLDYEEKEIVGRNWFDNFLPERMRREVKTVFDELMKGHVKPVEYFENPVLTKDGDERLIAWHNTVLRDKNGNITSVLSSGEDITERKRVETQNYQYQQQLKSLVLQLTQAEEQEQKRIADLLHDNLAQTLVFLKIKIGMLAQQDCSTLEDQELKEINHSLQKLLDQTRNLSFDLSSPLLYTHGLEAALKEWIADKIERKHGREIRFEEDENLKPLPQKIQAMLFQMTRELLINVVKHAQALRVTVSLKNVDQGVEVGVRDDGIGMDAKALKGTAGFGLFSIEERIASVGGHIAITSKPGQGTLVTLRVPLDANQNSMENKR